MTASGRCQAAPQRWKQAVLTWIAIYPTITLVLWLLGPLERFDLPLPLRTLIITVVLVPGMVFVLIPGLSRLLGGWLRRGAHR